MLAAIEGVSPDRAIDRAWRGRTTRLGERAFHLIAAGKAAAPMVRAFLARATGRCRGGVLTSTGGDGTPEGAIVTFLAGHPVPNLASLEAGRRALEVAARVPADEDLVVLLSGGASALMAVPAATLSLEDKIAATRALLASGVPIDAMNCVRKHLSAIKGGQLARASAGAVTTWAISDIVAPVEDDPSLIGSGPTVGDPTTFADAWRISGPLASELPRAVIDHLRAGVAGASPDTPKPSDSALARSTFTVIANRRQALAAAKAAAGERVYRTLILPDPVVGEARVRAAEHVRTAAAHAQALGRPCCVISGGETTVRVRGAGKGGRNQEFALAALSALPVDHPTVLISAGTDGIDGPTDAAGAIVDSTTMARAASLSLGSPERYLDANDAYRFFEPLGDLFVTGPSGTNVADIQVAIFG